MGNTRRKPDRPRVWHDYGFRFGSWFRCGESARRGSGDADRNPIGFLVGNRSKVGMGGIDEAGPMETSSLAAQAPMAATDLKENFGFPRLRSCLTARASGVLVISVCLVLSLQAEQAAQDHPPSK